MSNRSFEIKNPQESDIPALRTIWKESFGSEGMDTFFRCLYRNDHALVAVKDNEIAAAGYIVPAGNLICAEQQYPCAMLYALAVLPQYRGAGIGAALTRKLKDLALSGTYRALVTCPSSGSLFEFYAKTAGFRDFFYVYTKGISATAEPKDCGHTQMYTAMPHKKTAMQPAQDSQSPQPTLERLSHDEYNKLRNNLLKDILKDTIYIMHDIKCVQYQELLCDELGGGLYKIGNSCAVVEVQSDGAVWVKELLLGKGDDESESEITAAICTQHPSHEFIYRTPAASGKGERFAMLTMPDEIIDDISNAEIEGLFGCSTYAPWFGPAFD